MEKVQVSEKVSGYIYFLKSSNNKNYILNYTSKSIQYFWEKNIYKKPLEYLRWIFDHSATWSKVLGMLKVLQTSVDG